MAPPRTLSTLSVSVLFLLFFSGRTPFAHKKCSSPKPSFPKKYLKNNVLRWGERNRFGKRFSLSPSRSPSPFPKLLSGQCLAPRHGKASRICSLPRRACGGLGFSAFFFRWIAASARHGRLFFPLTGGFSQAFDLGRLPGERPNGGPQSRARCDGGSYGHRQLSLCCRVSYGVAFCCPAGGTSVRAARCAKGGKRRPH